MNKMLFFPCTNRSTSLITWGVSALVLLGMAFSTAALAQTPPEESEPVAVEESATATEGSEEEVEEPQPESPPEEPEAKDEPEPTPSEEPQEESTPVEASAEKPASEDAPAEDSLVDVDREMEIARLTEGS